jgi:transcriptional regulator with PAS, ATPase and Fis domain
MIMIHLLFVVPYPELMEQVKEVVANHPEREKVNADVQALRVDEIPDIPAGTYDAIIARGYTAQKTLTKYSETTPTIRVHISGYDIIRSVYECREKYHPKKIAICGLDESLSEAASVCKILGVEANVYAPVRNQDLPQVLNKAIEDGCDALVSGYSANLLAGKMGLNSVVIQTGAAALSQAMDEAIYTVERIRHERVISQMYKTIIYSSDAGLLYVDREGIIRVRNHVARQMNGNVSIMGKPLKMVISWLEPLFCSVMKNGKVETRLISIPGSKITVSVKCSPVIANNELSGVVFNLTDVTQIQELESQIRRKLSERGLKARYTFDQIIHKSKEIDRVIQLAGRYAASDSNVIIIGETGTGKELFAQSIHNASKRKNGPFVAVNCAALPENLLESELFGYVEGAFTGTSKGGKMGLFEQAHGGTLFLDEVGEISMAIQTKLLRVLQERQVRRIGDNKVINVDVRIISATNKSIRKMADVGQFRRDLVYRLDVLRLFLPPLREREADVELLFVNQLQGMAKRNGQLPVKIEAGVFPLLCQYPFFGNIRELRNIAERVFVLHEGDIINAHDVHEALYPADLDMDPSFAISTGTGLAELTETQEQNSENFLGEEERLRQALKISGGNKGKAAKLLGIDRSTLWRRMKKYEI